MMVMMPFCIEKIFIEKKGRQYFAFLLGVSGMRSKAEHALSLESFIHVVVIFQIIQNRFLLSFINLLIVYSLLLACVYLCKACAVEYVT